MTIEDRSTGEGDLRFINGYVVESEVTSGMDEKSESRFRRMCLRPGLM